MLQRGKHAAPRPTGRQTRIFRRAVPLALVLVLAVSSVALAYEEGDSSNLANNKTQCDTVNGTFVSGGTGPGAVHTCTFTVEGEEVVFRTSGNSDNGWTLQETVEVEVSKGTGPGEVTSVEIVNGGCFNPGGKLMKPGTGHCPQPDA